MFTKMTPVLFTNDVNACSQFWIKRLGASLTAEVPGPDGPLFAMLQLGPIEIMYQSFTSMAEEPEKMRAAAGQGPTFLFVEVADLEQPLKATDGLPRAKDVHNTFYGSREFTVSDPAGHFITFAQMGVATA